MLQCRWQQTLALQLRSVSRSQELTSDLTLMIIKTLVASLPLLHAYFVSNLPITDKIEKQERKEY